MINTVDHNVTIDLGALTSTAPDIRIKQQDADSHKFVFAITENGVAYDLTGLTARAYFVKGDGTKVYQDCTLDTPMSGIMSAILTTQCLTVSGFVSCEVTIYGTTGELLTSASFIFRVLDIDRDDTAIESTNEYSALNNALLTVTQYDTRIESLEEEVQTARGGQTSLDARLDVNVQQITDLETQKADNTRVDNIIAQSGTSDTEVVDARVSAVKSKTFTIIKERFEEIESDFESHEQSYTPHKFYDYQNNKELVWGYEIDVNGVLNMVIADPPLTLTTVVHETFTLVDIFETNPNLLNSVAFINYSNASNIVNDAQTGLLTFNKISLTNPVCYVRHLQAAFNQIFLCIKHKSTAAITGTFRVSGEAEYFSNATVGNSLWKTDYFLGAAQPKAAYPEGVRYEFLNTGTVDQVTFTIDLANSIMIDTSMFAVLPTEAQMTEWFSAYLILKEVA